MDPSSHAFSRQLACMAGNAYPQATPLQQQVSDSLGMIADNPKMGPMMRALTEDDSLMTQPHMAVQGTYPQNSYASSGGHLYHNPFSPSRTPQNIPFYPQSHLNNTGSADYTSSSLQSPGYGASGGFGHYQRQIPTPSPVMGGGIGSPNGHHGTSYPRSASAGPTIPSPVMMQGSTVYSNSHTSPSSSIYGHGLQTSSSQMTHSSRNMRSPAALHSPKSLPTSSPIPFSCSNPSAVNSVAYGQSMPSQTVTDRQQNVYSTSKSPGINRTFQYSLYNNQGLNPQHSTSMSRNRTPDQIDQRVKSPPYLELVHSKSPPPVKQQKAEVTTNCNVPGNDGSHQSKLGAKKDKGSLPKLEEMVAFLGEPAMKGDHLKQQQLHQQQQPSSEQAQGIKEHLQQNDSRPLMPQTKWCQQDCSIQSQEASDACNQQEGIAKDSEVSEKQYDQQQVRASSINHSNRGIFPEAGGKIKPLSKEGHLLESDCNQGENVSVNGRKSPRDKNSTEKEEHVDVQAPREDCNILPKEKKEIAENGMNSHIVASVVADRKLEDATKDVIENNVKKQQIIPNSDNELNSKTLSVETIKMVENSHQTTEVRPDRTANSGQEETDNTHRNGQTSRNEMENPSQETVAKKDVKGIVTLIPNTLEEEVRQEHTKRVKESGIRENVIEEAKKNGQTTPAGNGHEVVTGVNINTNRNCQVMLNKVLHTSSNKEKNEFLLTSTSNETASKQSPKDAITESTPVPSCGEAPAALESKMTKGSSVSQSLKDSTSATTLHLVTDTGPTVISNDTNKVQDRGLETQSTQCNNVAEKGGNMQSNRMLLISPNIAHVKEDDEKQHPKQERLVVSGVNTDGKNEQFQSLNSTNQGPLFLIATEESQLKLNAASVVITPLRIPATETSANLKRKRPVERMPSTGDQSTLPLKKRKGRPPGSKSKVKRDSLLKQTKRKGNKQSSGLDDEEQQELRKFKHLQHMKKAKHSDNPNRGPFLNVKGSLDNVLSSEVVNSSDSGPSKYRRVSRVLSIPSSITSKGPTANASTVTVHPRGKWRCAFCGKRSFYGSLGDLFGPYYPTGCHFEPIHDEHSTSKEYSTSSNLLSSKVTPHRKMPSRNLHAKGNQKPIKTYPGKTKNGPTFLSTSPPPTNLNVVRVFPVKGQNDDRSGMTSPRDRALEKEMEKDEVWVHEDCLIWSQGVYAISGTLYGLHAAVKEAMVVECTRCQDKGATLGCRTKGCKKAFHYLCAIEVGCLLHEHNFSMTCPQHKNKKLKMREDPT